jgi:hypothetical protein
VADAYTHLFLADPHVSRNATHNIARWVAKGVSQSRTIMRTLNSLLLRLLYMTQRTFGPGGVVMATAGASLRDEFIEPNEGAAALFGVFEVGGRTDPSPLNWAKEDLPFAAALDHFSAPAPGVTQRCCGHNTLGLTADSVTALGGGLAARVGGTAYGAVSYVNLTANSTAVVHATFASNGSAAVTVNKRGSGAAIYAGLLPGLTYFKQALPARPVDRCNNDGNWSKGSGGACYAHFHPEDFDMAGTCIITVHAVLKHIADPVRTNCE